ncbi:MAG: acyl carrier protein [Acidobacteriota bacterium]
MSHDDNPKIQTARQVLSEISGVDAAELQPQQELVSDLGIDSPKALKLLVELEDRLDIEISDEEAAGLNTVGDIFSYLGAIS